MKRAYRRFFVLLSLTALLISIYCLRGKFDSPLNKKNSCCPEISGYPHKIKFVLKLGFSEAPHALSRANRIATSCFDQIHCYFNKWNQNSEVSLFNQLPAHIFYRPSPQLYELIILVDQIAALTDGRFDPTVELARDIWRRKLETGSVPTDIELQSLKNNIGWERLKISKGKLMKTTSLELDFGGVEKGYCVDKIAERLSIEGINNFYIEWGGELRTSGSRLDGAPWRAGIEIRKKGVEEHEIIQMGDTALATSGCDRQLWSIGERQFSHIIDPKSLQAILCNDQAPITCTVMAKSCATADALATAGMLFSTSEEALSWFSQLQSNQLQCVWLTDRQKTLKLQKDH